MIFIYTVEVEVQKVEGGKFVSADEINAILTETLEDTEPSFDLDGIGPDGNSVYEIVNFSVDGGFVPSRTKKKGKA